MINRRSRRLSASRGQSPANFFLGFFHGPY